MAHVVGVPRRDPCQKCQLPVFLAERLTVGKKVFHRTCLKCARCGSQLAIGSFYETEVDDVFCCETCPDEEEFDEGLDNGSKVELRGSVGEDSKTSTKTVRNSIADRLAFFEQGKDNGTQSQHQTQNVLQKSVSDEEKSKDLEANAAAAASTSTAYKMNSALSSFLNDTIDGEDSSEKSSKAIDQTTPMETTDTEEESESLSLDNNKPELPKTQPPLIEEPEEENLTRQESKRFTATAQLQLSAPEKQAEPEIVEPAVSKIETVDDDEAHKSSNDLDLSAILNDNDNEQVTKDIKADAIVTPVLAEIVENVIPEEVVELRRKSVEENKENKTENSNVTQLVVDNATTERLSVVRARLQQFEEITNNQNNNSNSNNNNNVNENENQQEKLLTTTPANNENLMQINENPIANNDNDNEHNEIKLNVNNENEKENNDAIEITNTTAMTAINIEPKSMPQKIEQNEIEMEMETTKSITPQPSRRNLTPTKRMDIQNEAEEKEIVKNIDVEKQVDEEVIKETPEVVENLDKKLPSTPSPTKIKTKTDDYPDDLNPFASDDDDDADNEIEMNKENAQNNNKTNSILRKSQKLDNSNPFDSSDDEIELEKSNKSNNFSTPLSSSSRPVSITNSSGKVRPPRPPPPRISRNPFEGESDDNDEQHFSRNSSLSSSAKRKTPVPTPRSNLSQSQNPTPEPTPRLSNKSAIKSSPPQSLALHSSSDHYGSFNSLGGVITTTTTTPLQRNSDIRGSNNSLTSSAGGTIRSRKNRKAPAPPQPPTVKELFPSTETLGSSITSTPSSSTVGSPKSSRKKRPAPAPPKPARLEANILTQITNENESKNLHNYPLQSSTSSKLSDEEKALLEGKTDEIGTMTSVVAVVAEIPPINPQTKLAAVTRRNSRRLIPLDPTLLKDAVENAHENPQCDDQKQQELNEKAAEEEHHVVYRRVIMPPTLNTPIHERNPIMDSLESQDRQSEKLKDNKEAKNRNRQSQQSASSGAEDNDATIYNKAAHGKWKRRKGPAPALPIPPRKVLQMLPLQEIRHELEIIEVQQQGLEKQGVVLEKMIRDRCEGQCGEQLNSVAANALVGAGDSDGLQKFKQAQNIGEGGVQNSKEVEDLILQLFELVNEKNELFRRQAELMYLRRQHRLEQEQADLEYEIRVLMAQPECNKTDSDKAREEALIARLVDVVQLRNEVIERLEMDRVREAEEDLSIKIRLEQHNAKRDGHDSDDSSKKHATKLSKKEKKKQKEAKKLGKNKKNDADKDADETELNVDKQKKKKKRKFLF